MRGRRVEQEGIMFDFCYAAMHDENISRDIARYLLAIEPNTERMVQMPPTSHAVGHLIDVFESTQRFGAH